MDGYLLIDKPKGWTSFDVVAKVRSLLRPANGKSASDSSRGARIRVGHAGTLDPMATGLLIVLVGRATKQQDNFMKLDKVYKAELTFGYVSDTYDAEGELTLVSQEKPDSDTLEATLYGWVGEIKQMPPAYSAIKINGKKAYEIARKGYKPALRSRNVTIYSIDDINYHYPKLSFTTHVSSGTYIRSLAHDIGEQVNLGAYLSGLRRTKIGRYSVDDAVSIEDLRVESLPQYLNLISDNLKTLTS